ncbi:MAG: aminomethyl-transferring glycine dehydrogenase subunit GcvPA [bacterium]
MPFIPNTDEDRKAMLKTIGVDSFEELISNIPENLRVIGELNLPKPLSEYEVVKELKSIAEKNNHTQEFISFLGGGAYDHYIPAAVDHIISRPEFFTAYTPYQPEVSQGTLQTIYEYQTMICELTGMDASNASMYDGGSALAEATLVAISETGRNQVLVSKALHPNYIKIIRTYCKGQGFEVTEIDLADGTTNLKDLKEKISDKTAAVIIQHPNFLGILEEMQEFSDITHKFGALFISFNDPISLGILTPPGEYGADIVIGEGQCLGNSLNFGGPYLGIFAVKENLIRRMPGRIAGATVDRQGRRGFVLTLQTREQHIRREKATSNICTNQALNALAATVYLALLGKQGIKEVAMQCLQKSHYLAGQISRLDGYRLKYNQPFFKEFVVETPIPPQQIIDALLKKRIIAGINLHDYEFGLDSCLLIAVTEKRNKNEMDLLVEEFKNVVIN